jgi:hypothetical protein
MPVELTGQASNDDVKQCQDSIDNGKEDGGNRVNDCENHAADGAEDGFNLETPVSKSDKCSDKLTQETTAPILRNVCVLCW